MVITVLISCIAIIALFQPNAPRLFAAVCFAVITLCHEVYFGDLDGLQYYGSAALLDLAIIVITSGINPVPKMVVTLHKICLVSIIANLMGWALWFFHLSPVAYEAVFVVIYAWTLITLLKRNGSDVGGYTLDSWRTCLRFNRYTRASCHFKNGFKV